MLDTYAFGTSFKERIHRRVPTTILICSPDCSRLLLLPGGHKKSINGSGFRIRIVHSIPLATLTLPCFHAFFIKFSAYWAGLFMQTCAVVEAEQPAVSASAAAGVFESGHAPSAENLETIGINQLRREMRANRVTFPAQVPVFVKHDRPDLQRKVVQ